MQIYKDALINSGIGAEIILLPDNRVSWAIRQVKHANTRLNSVNDCTDAHHLRHGVQHADGSFRRYR